MVRHGANDTKSIITGAMPTPEILSRLSQHGCMDITSEVDLPSSGRTPVSTGGSGDVYLGVLVDGRQVAIKCLRVLIGADEQGMQHAKRAAHELYVWSRCKHPNILELFGVAQYEGRVAMLSPWMKNGNLSWYISQYPQADIYHLCVQISDSVAYLRHCGVVSAEIYYNVLGGLKAFEWKVHGDIKGVNFVVSDDHVPKLTDFGSSTMNQCSLRFTTTEDSSKMTLRWTAPEIFLGKTKYTFEGDVYSLGMTILEVISRSAPWAGMPDVTVMGKLAQGLHPVRVAPFLTMGDRASDAVWELMVSCWASDPRQRPHAVKVRDELDTIRKQLQLVSHRTADTRLTRAPLTANTQAKIEPTPKGTHAPLEPSPRNNGINLLRRLLHQRDSRSPSSSHEAVSLAGLNKVMLSWRNHNNLATDRLGQEPHPEPWIRTEGAPEILSQRALYTPTHSSRKVLLIGSSYRNHQQVNQRLSITSLDGVLKGFEQLESDFSGRGYSVQTLPEEPGFDRKRILSWVAHFVDHATSGDVRAIVFSGHGRRSDDGTVSLIPPECPSESAGITCSERDLNIRNHSRPGVVVFSIMAHCFSGEVMKQNLDRQALEKPTRMDVSEKNEPIYMTFAAGDETVYESKLMHELPVSRTSDHFIHALVEAFRSVDVTTSTWGNLFEAFDWHFRKTRSCAYQADKQALGWQMRNWRSNHPQTPRFSASRFVLSDFGEV